MKSNDELKSEISSIKKDISHSKIINQIDLESLRKKCINASPFSHICIDGMWERNFLEKIRYEVCK